MTEEFELPPSNAHAVASSNGTNHVTIPGSVVEGQTSGRVGNNVGEHSMQQNRCACLCVCVYRRGGVSHTKCTHALYIKTVNRLTLSAIVQVVKIEKKLRISDFMVLRKFYRILNRKSVSCPPAYRPFLVASKQRTHAKINVSVNSQTVKLGQSTS